MGVLTQFLPWKEGKVALIELDNESVNYLQAHYAPMAKNIYEGDFLRVNLKEIMGADPLLLSGISPIIFLPRLF